MFSEDLDFSLLETNLEFNLKPYEEAIISTLVVLLFKYHVLELLETHIVLMVFKEFLSSKVV